MPADPRIDSERPQTGQAELASGRAAQRDPFQARGREAQAHMERTGVAFSVEEVSAFLTARIEARRVELLKHQCAGN